MKDNISDLKERIERGKKIIDYKYQTPKQNEITDNTNIRNDPDSM